MPSCYCRRCRAPRDPKLTRVEHGGDLLIAERDSKAYAFKVAEPCPNCGTEIVVMRAGVDDSRIAKR